MKDSSKVDAEGNILKKPEAIMYYNRNMGEVDLIDQQLHGIQILRKTYKWYQKIFFHMVMLALLNSQKLYKSMGGKFGFLQFIHDVMCSLVSDAPNLR